MVMDFGIAASLTEMQAGTDRRDAGVHVAGAGGRTSVDARADVFSAAVVLAEMVSPRAIGRRISERQTQAVGGAARGPASVFRPDLGARCSAGR